MTDLEMTKLCAEAMGLNVEVHPIRGTILRHWFMDRNVEREYNPLHDDAQAMALVKHLKLSVAAIRSLWQASTRDEEGILVHQAYDADLNRAIVECAVKVHLAKTKVAA